MADEITIGSKAIKEVQDLRSELVLLSQELTKINKNTISISTPSGLNKSGADNAKVSAELDTLKGKYISLNETIVKKAEQSRLSEIRLQQQRERAFDTFEKNAKKEEQILAKSQSLYNKTQEQINRLTVVYNNLSLKKARYNDLSAHEEMRLNTLQKVTEKYNGILKNTDAQIGKNQRNVGNYASGYNALGNSINQLTREAPAFVNSINTGFMAISNNIPALTDAISDLRKQNALLRAEGKPTQSVLSLLAGAFFSLQTAISLGVTLLTLYGGAIVGAITGSKKRKEALEAEKKAIEEKTKAEQDARDAIASVQAIEVSRSKILFETAKNLSLSYKQRAAAVKELQERYPDYLGHLTKEQILAGDTAKEEERLNLALINRGKALAAQTFLQKNLEQQLSLEIEIGKLNEKKFKFDQEATKMGSKIVVYTDQQKQIAQQKRDVDRKSNSENLFSLNERLTLLKREQEAFLNIYNENAKYLDTVKETTKATQEKTKATKIDSVGQVSLNKAQDGALERLIQLKKALELTRDETSKNASEFQQFEKSISDVNEAINVLTKPITVDIKIKGTPEVSKEVKGMSQYLKSFIDDFSNATGFSSTFEILQNKVKDFGKDFATTFNGITEIAQETFNFVNQFSQANFENEKERLQNQYDVALTYAGDNAAAKKKIEEDFEKEKKDIANREAKAKKEQAIFNIAIDTAQAIVGLWADPGFPAAIPLALVVAGLGAAQIAMVSAQKVPQYFMGGTHEGGLMMVNDGAGSNFKETIVTPDGKITQPTGRNVLMNAPKGTEIFTHEQWNEQLNGMLRGSGINWNNQQNNYSGISKEDLKEVMMESIGSQSHQHNVWDRKGFGQYIEKGGNITRNKVNRGNSKGYKF